MIDKDPRQVAAAAGFMCGLPAIHTKMVTVYNHKDKATIKRRKANKAARKARRVNRKRRK